MPEERKRTRVVWNVLPLGFVSFFTDISSEMVFSILPSFILGLPGAGYAVLGFIEGLAEFSVMHCDLLLEYFPINLGEGR